MWLLTKKVNKFTEEYVEQYNSMPTEYELIDHITSITTIAELLDKGTSDFNGVEWLLVELK